VIDSVLKISNSFNIGESDIVDVGEVQPASEIIAEIAVVDPEICRIELMSINSESGFGVCDRNVPQDYSLETSVVIVEGMPTRIGNREILQ